jgi:hypothetical protein
MPGPSAWMAGAAVSTIALMTTGKTSRSILSTNVFFGQGSFEPERGL